MFQAQTIQATRFFVSVMEIRRMFSAGSFVQSSSLDNDHAAIMDYTKLKQERISSTKIAPYDMITAVTQRAINKQFEKMHKVNSTLKTLSILSADPDDPYSRLDAELNAPTIELRLGTESEPLGLCLLLI
ncbi:hypothetical protein M413DRAFT_137227 [Hebeloma cylindrosporum]|uniref:Uncharacterized protein n=1 Tax=Hebeloma cylindrosporum TaxID=76867 RepID=A0A0C2YL42_HEBCY|nr:hypothetical protein M413DRAFT_137227 [Hebeloma cylindrosporum h7]